MIKPVSRRTKRIADFEGITKEFVEDYEVEGFEIRFHPASEYSGESYYAVGDGETLGEIEICSECEHSFVAIAGSIYDEEYCIECGAARD